MTSEHSGSGILWHVTCLSFPLTFLQNSLPLIFAATAYFLETKRDAIFFFKVGLGARQKLHVWSLVHSENLGTGRNTWDMLVFKE